ncbi:MULTISPECIES: class I SAM-dependent methyltransferase [unclassified Pseudomonas]|uniref:class I SAM-dependent methyltransferase n=1 Tax=unclassified Pseudomonas TaxID=196821 RepID=UPI00244A41E0|nr:MULTISPECIES: class I SAM-dependent methyltransferase [unclassified Pseudomonas]MDG9924421.1 class I SAM-dependent methyltransferase [Pseudomonas sp. GD04045]MDH0035239.1 class I SAM-dependent methyltransferase [Pseudomonas sp. GD04019]
MKESLPARYFDTLYRNDPDPWSFRSRWYEQRKRNLILACLPRPHFHRAFEPACANGEISAELARRAESVLCSDYSVEALSLARTRLAEFSNVQLARHTIPEDWPAGRFDLIVLGEFGYYLTPEAWQRTCEQAARSLVAGGVLVACHWRHPLEGSALSGDAVHEHLSRAMRALPTVRHVETDFRLELWCAPEEE